MSEDYPNPMPCPICGKAVRLRRGRLCQHGHTRSGCSYHGGTAKYASSPCRGSGVKPEEFWLLALMGLFRFMGKMRKPVQ